MALRFSSCSGTILAVAVAAVIVPFTAGRSLPPPDADECPAVDDCRQEVDLTLVVDESSDAGKLTLSIVAKELMNNLNQRKGEVRNYILFFKEKKNHVDSLLITVPFFFLLWESC